MDVRFRSCSIGLLLILATCLPAWADEAVTDTITDPHASGLQDAAEGAADTARTTKLIVSSADARSSSGW